jgi:TctA family transporter
MRAKLFIKPFQLSVTGTAVTGITGGVVGSFMGGPIFIIGMALIGALIGNVVWMMGGQDFFLFIVVGIFLGSALAIFLNGMESALIGAGTGGAIGGFVAVNKSMLTK